MKNKYFILAVMLLSVVAGIAQKSDTLLQNVVDSKTNNTTDEHWRSSRPDGHAPAYIGMYGDHYHKKGEVMLAYYYMPMWMNGNLSGSHKISNAAVSQNYMMVPQAMQMNMHMLMAMYAPTNWLTLMAMGSYITNSMSDKMIMGEMQVLETMKTSGFGDVSLYGLFKIVNKKRQSFQANVGLSMPSGSINKKSDMPAMGFHNVPMDYTMQLGSGTFDPIIGATYLGQTNHFSWGTLPMYTVRAYKNSQGYSLGNRFDVTTWGAYKICNWVSISGSLAFFNTSKIQGRNKNFTPSLMPQLDAVNSGRSQLDVGIGSNFYVPKGKMKNFRVGAEVKIPVYQYVNGIQMRSTVCATFSIQYAIGKHNH